MSGFRPPVRRLPPTGEGSCSPGRGGFLPTLVRNPSSRPCRRTGPPLRARPARRAGASRKPRTVHSGKVSPESARFSDGKPRSAHSGRKAAAGAGDPTDPAGPRPFGLGGRPAVEEPACACDGLQGDHGEAVGLYSRNDQDGGAGASARWLAGKDTGRKKVAAAKSVAQICGGATPPCSRASSWARPISPHAPSHWHSPGSQDEDPRT